MESTSISLLERLRSEGDSSSWGRFTELYTPLLFYWLRKKGVSDEDAADVVQEVFCVLLKELPHFRYDPSRTFRGWLRAVTINKHREIRRRKQLPIEIELSDGGDVAAPEDDHFWNVEYKTQLIERASQLIRSEFSERTWDVYQAYVQHGRTPKEVAIEFGIKEAEVYRAKSQILNRLRVFLDGVLD